MSKRYCAVCSAPLAPGDRGWCRACNDAIERAARAHVRHPGVRPPAALAARLLDYYEARAAARQGLFDDPVGRLSVLEGRACPSAAVLPSGEEVPSP